MAIKKPHEVDSVLLAEGSVNVYFFVRQGDAPLKAIMVSGVVIDREKGIVATTKGTLEHIVNVAVSAAPKYPWLNEIINMTPNTSGLFPARISAHDVVSDVTFLKVDKTWVDRGAPEPAVFAQTGKVSSGDKVFYKNVYKTIQTNQLAAATVSRTPCHPEAPACPLRYNFFELDTFVGQRNFGGPVYNSGMEIIGMIAAGLEEKSGMKKTIVMDVKDILWIHNQLELYGTTTPYYSGILLQNVTDKIAPFLGLDEVRGVIVTNVTENSPGQSAGLQPGDVILSVNGKKVFGSGQFVKLMQSPLSGSKVVLTIMRLGKKLSVQVSRRFPGDEDRKKMKSAGKNLRDLIQQKMVPKKSGEKPPP